MNVWNMEDDVLKTLFKHTKNCEYLEVIFWSVLTDCAICKQYCTHISS